ncbi:MAG TPA: hypothetical protein DDY86_07065 [Syntrophaceae bacterium]|nr:hypothetical protein [Syntrophaceae bacterium]
MSQFELMAQWTKDDLELLRLWYDENKDTKVRVNKIPEKLKNLFPHRTDAAIYGRYRAMVTAPKLLNDQAAAAPHDDRNTAEQLLKEWIIKNPAQVVSKSKGHLYLNTLYPSATSRQVYRRWISARKSMGMSSTPKASKNMATIVVMMINAATSAIVDVFNKELERRVATEQIKIGTKNVDENKKYIEKIESLKEEIAELKEQERATAAIRQASYDYFAKHHPNHKIR